jgi:hypothetical protein
VLGRAGAAEEAQRANQSPDRAEEAKQSPDRAPVPAQSPSRVRGRARQSWVQVAEPARVLVDPQLSPLPHGSSFVEARYETRPQQRMHPRRLKPA